MRKNTWIILFFIGLCSAAYSQGFTNINAGLVGTHWGDVAWGDYDGDGDLDVIVTGMDAASVGQTNIYENIGGDNFTLLSGLTIPGTYIGDVAWGDYDANGFLDILILGYTSGVEITKLYRNNGEGGFDENLMTFPALTDGSTSFIDYNNDGYLDLLISGFDGTANVAFLYKNNGDASFSDSNISLPGAIKSSYEWGDYDNDGDMDIFITGFDVNGALISKLFENIENEEFIETSNAFVGAWLGDMAWGDYDNDGDLDILLSGYTASTERVTKVYKNDGEGGFEELLSTGLIGVSHSSTIWGDYNNDGDLDVFIAGTYEGSGSWVRVMDVFINNGDDTFTAAGLIFDYDAFWGESAWGDYDNDGDLDLICSGHDDLGGSNTIIYKNENSTSNTPPTAPENLVANIIDNNVSLSWDASIDNETPSAGLSYNAYIRNESGEIIWNSMALVSDGSRFLPALGNAQQNTAWEINGLPNGNYYCAVQAIDHIYAGSAFCEEVFFEIEYVGIDNNTESENVANLHNYPNPFTESTTISYNLTKTGFVQISIFDINGKLVQSLVNENRNAGIQTDFWNGESNLGTSLESGLYYYLLKIDGVLVTREKCMLLK